MIATVKKLIIKSFYENAEFTHLKKLSHQNLDKLRDARLQAPPSSRGTSAQGFVLIIGLPT